MPVVTTIEEDDLKLAAGSRTAVLVSAVAGGARAECARQIHDNSGCATGPFVTLRDGSVGGAAAAPILPAGASEGAVLRDHFEQARGGTLFIDDIAELSVEMQRHLFLALDDHGTLAAGGASSNVRVIAGASRTLDNAIESGMFFEPLFYRLNVIHLDFLADTALKAAGVRVREVMTTTPCCCDPDTNLAAVAKLMWDNDCGFVPIVEASGIVTGVVTDRDICMASATRRQLPEDLLAAAAMSTLVHVCRQDDDICDALLTMKHFQVRRLPVVDSRGRVQGVIALNDIVRTAAEKRAPGAVEIVAALAAIFAPRIVHKAAVA